MSYRIAGVDVHKKMLAVVVSNVEIEGEYHFERCQFGSNPGHLRLLSEWLIEAAAEFRLELKPPAEAKSYQLYPYTHST